MFKQLSALILIIAFFSVGTISADPVAKPTTVRYRATFTSTWSQDTHPHPSGNLPNTAHWSVLVGGTHDDSVSFWDAGQLASLGIKNVAERGANSELKNEIGAAIDAGSAELILEDDELLFSDSGTLTMEFDVTSTFDRVTLVTMIAPSPDWFVGVSGQPLRAPNGEWLDEVVVDLYPYDAGTDSAPDYNHTNTATNPADPISNAQGVAPFSTASLGTLTFTRLTNPTAVTLNSAGVGQANHTMLFAIALLGLLTLQLVSRTQHLRPLFALKLSDRIKRDHT